MTRTPSAQTPHRIALLFNANKACDREIISGIGQYLQTTRRVGPVSSYRQQCRAR